MKLFLHSGHVFVFPGDLRNFSEPGIVFMFISCHETPTVSYTERVNSDPTTECGSCLDFDFSKVS